VKGNVRATGRIEIKKDGSIVGNLTTAQIMIEDGADFKGFHRKSTGARRRKPAGTSPRAPAAAGAESKHLTSGHAT